MSINTEHLIMRNVDRHYQAECRACGAVYRPSLPIPMGEFASALRRFVTEHQGCASQEAPITLAPKLADTLVRIERYIDRHGYAPSIRELCEITCTPSTSTVAYRLDQLERAGAIQRKPGAARSITVNPVVVEVAA